MNKKFLNTIIEQALNILIDEKGIAQIEIQNKLKSLDILVSKSSISNLRNQKNTGLLIQKKAAKGLSMLLEKEHCLQFNERQKKFVTIPDCKPKEIITFENNALQTASVNENSYIIHDGRRDVQDKVKLYNAAKEEVLEIGIRLRSFKSYFDGKRESAFREPLSALLDRGVHFKCYTLKPDGNFARRYIEDRAIVQPSEANILSTMSAISKELESIFIQINREGRPGKLELYHYDHFPYFHATVVDGATALGHMNIAPYLYGVSRANAPVIELKRKNNMTLYKKYWRSITAIINSKGVTKVV